MKSEDKKKKNKLASGTFSYFEPKTKSICRSRKKNLVVEFYELIPFSLLTKFIVKLFCISTLKFAFIKSSLSTKNAFSIQKFPSSLTALNVYTIQDKAIQKNLFFKYKGKKITFFL